MPKRKECKVKGFEGHAIFHDPLNMEQVFAIEEAQDTATDIEPSKFLTKVNELRGAKDEATGEIVKASWSSKVDKLLLPAIMLCVKEWHLENVPEGVSLETFPMTPRGTASELVNWLWTQIIEVYQGEVSVPNE
jgi:hypothetical protein